MPPPSLRRLFTFTRLSSSAVGANPPSSFRSKTPLESQFETWIHKLKPGFAPADVAGALKAQSDPELALDIFRWTAQQPRYKHTPQTYLTLLTILVNSRRFRHTETLLEEVLAGACALDTALYNAIVRFCCGRRTLFNKSFDVYKKMLSSEKCKPTLETYAMLLNSLLRRFNNKTVCFVYLRSVRSLEKQMKQCGVIPDTFVLNLIIKAYSKCLEVDEAMRVFREMGLYGCEANAYTYGYIAKGLCEKALVGQGLGFYKEMREKGLVPSSSTFMVVICSLALERRYEDACEVVFDMLGIPMSPDVLTYKTVLEGLCRDGRGEEAFDLLESFRSRDRAMNERTYKTLLNALHFINRE